MIFKESLNALRAVELLKSLIARENLCQQKNPSEEGFGT